MNHFFKNTLYMFLFCCTLTTSYIYSDELFGSYLSHKGNLYKGMSRGPASEVELVDFSGGELNLLSLNIVVNSIEKSTSCNNRRCKNTTSNSKIRSAILKVYDYCLKNNYKDRSIESISKKLISSNDRKLKEAAFLLLTTQKATDNNLKLVINNIFSTNDPNLIGLSIMEFDRYRSADQKKMIVNAFKEQFEKDNLSQGSLLYKYAHNYLDKKTIDSFKRRDNLKYDL